MDNIIEEPLTSVNTKKIILNGDQKANIEEKTTKVAENVESTKAAETGENIKPARIVRPGEIFEKEAAEKKIKIESMDRQEVNKVEENKSSGRVLTFHVKFKDKIEKISLPYEETLDKLQEYISNLFEVPPSRQIFHGCGLHGSTSEEIPNKHLSNLKISSQNYLTVEEVMEYKFPICLLEQNSGRKTHLNLSNLMRVHELKQYVYCICDIPVRYQDWNGLNDQKDEATLEQAGLKMNDEITVRSLQSQFLNSTGSTSSERLSDSCSDEESDSDLSSLEAYFPVVPASSPSQNSLIEGSYSFAYKYKMRFGHPIPEFYAGELGDAFKKTCSEPYDKKKILAIYLHHDDSILTNIFCHRVLKAEKILNVLKHNFIVYGVDLTKKTPAVEFFGRLKSLISLEASSMAEGIVLDKLPAFMLVSQDIGDTHPLVSVIHGDVGVDELEHELLEQFELRINLAD
ncbi:FAS-associated factor 1-like [Drosophila takahashii]|uniref:FAS-associated factor 1-like n=1 Tax=Drosophila takahashii TaxID=29030 RepID=UPI003898D93E